MILNKVDFFLPGFARSVELQHLDETLAGFFDDAHLELQTEQLDADVEVVEELVDEAVQLFLGGLHHLHELGEDLMDDVQKVLCAPVLLIGEHVLYYCMSPFDNLILS